MNMNGNGQEISDAIRVRIDRAQIVCNPFKRRRKVPAVDGYQVVRDSFVRCQTTVPTYARCRELASVSSGARVFWQYGRQAGWLEKWKITFVADDRKGLVSDDLAPILRNCKDHRLLTVEVAFDFGSDSGVNRDFVKRHAWFGKSRPATATPGQLRFGGRKSGKLIRCYWKPEVSAFRVEVELHSMLLKMHNIQNAEDLAGLELFLIPRHFGFFRIDWKALRRNLVRKLGRNRGMGFLEWAQTCVQSVHRLCRHLRNAGVCNPHRFLVPMSLNVAMWGALTETVGAWRSTC